MRQHAQSDVLPWGSWLRAHGGVLQDAEGRSWSSVRDAFWHGHLGFPHDARRSHEHLELMLRTLAAIGARDMHSERRFDLFEGNLLFWHFYESWLFSIGLLVEAGPQQRDPDPLSEEGRSVLLMLQATRERDWTAKPFAAVREEIAAAGRGDAEVGREEALRRFEEGAAHLNYAFSRERLGRTPTITLNTVAMEARMPVRRVIWSQGFADATVRDDFYGWLAERLDRWEDWGGLAYWRGAADLTQHLLGLMMVRPTTAS